VRKEKERESGTQSLRRFGSVPIYDNEETRHFVTVNSKLISKLAFSKGLHSQATDFLSKLAACKILTVHGATNCRFFGALSSL